MTERLGELRRDFLPEHLAPLLSEVKLDGCVAVQARQSIAETRWLLELADQSPFIRGVVGWADLRAENLASQLEEFLPNRKFVGVRHVVQDEPDDRFLLQPDFLRGLGEVGRAGLTYDLLIFPQQLPAALEVVRALPEQLFVVDHLAKPGFGVGSLSPWREQMREMASFPNTMCKLSGLVTEATWRNWSAADFQPYLDVVFAAFGVDRLMFGSDWPVCVLSASYGQVYQLIDDYVGPLGADASRKIFGDNAKRFYDLETE
jgi:L-fuconolactonase